MFFDSEYPSLISGSVYLHFIGSKYFLRRKHISYFFPRWELWLFLLPGTLSLIKWTKYDMEDLYLEMRLSDAYLMQNLLCGVDTHTSIIVKN